MLENGFDFVVQDLDDFNNHILAIGAARYERSADLQLNSFGKFSAWNGLVVLMRSAAKCFLGGNDTVFLVASTETIELFFQAFQHIAGAMKVLHCAFLEDIAVLDLQLDLNANSSVFLDLHRL